ncbi:MAG: 7TM diverse intracellular signaling domain-containing protein [Chitinophagaceae bacterium]|nr:7TM diverse intracellular signaling domain-containing protein [Chitinophagaceae bacterium]
MKSAAAYYIIILQLLCTTSFSQADSVTGTTDIDKYCLAGNKIAYLIDRSGTTTPEQLPYSPFIYPNHKFLFKAQELNGNYFIRMILRNNSSRADSLLFYAGRAIDFRLYALDTTSGRLIHLSNKTSIYSSAVWNNIPYEWIIIPPSSQVTYYAWLDIKFFNWTYFDPVLIKPRYVTEFTYVHLLEPNRRFIYINTIITGIMIAMAVYAFMRFFRRRRREYLYYGIAAAAFVIYFAIHAGVYFSFGKPYHYFRIFNFHLLQITGFIFYLLFVNRFLSLKQQLPDINKLIKVLTGIQLVFLILDVFLAFSNTWHYISVDVFEGLRIFMLCCSLYIILILFSWKTRMAWYIAMGSLLLCLSGAAALYYSRTGYYNTVLFRIIGEPLVLFQAGIVMQMFFFMLGLGYKARMDEAEKARSLELLRNENERKELEKFRAVMEAKDKERSRIAQEIHDEIGSGLTAIRLLSELMKSKAEKPNTEEAGKISDTAAKLVTRMNEIVWTMNTRNDSLPNLVAYIRHMVVEFFEPFHINLKIILPDDIPDHFISGQVRRNILLTVKEALHNIVKHSGATRVEVEFIADSRFTIIIRDNGVGFDVKNVKVYRSGLRNMHDRLDHVGGWLSVSNGQGTSVQMQVPIR